MYKNKKILAFIPARIGSKRVKQKNLRKINNKSLFEYCIEIAKSSNYIDDIIVSTDSLEILNRSLELGCINNKLRPKELSGDKARIIDAIIYEIKDNNLNDYSAVVLLQPTFPYRTKEVLDDAIEKYFEKEISLITVVKAKEQPVFMRYIDDEGYLCKVIDETSDIRSQDFKQVYKIVGNIYINNIKQLNKETVLNENVIPYEIEERFCIDIDTEDDFQMAKDFMENENNNVSLC